MSKFEPVRKTSNNRFTLFDQFSNSRGDKEDGKDSRQTREGASDFLIADSERTLVRRR
jgi:hypothetical protein